MSDKLSPIIAVLRNWGRHFIRQFSSELFLDAERPAYEFMRRFYAQYNGLPGLDIMRQNGFSLLPATAPPAYYMERVVNRAIHNGVREKLADFQGAMTRSDIELLRRTVTDMYGVTHRYGTTEDVYSLPVAAEMVMEQYAETRDRGAGNLPGVPTGWATIDRVTGGIAPGEVCTWVARPNIGNAQPLDAPILTIIGWKPMSNIRVGDRLASLDGKENVVTHVHPQSLKQTYFLTVWDGRRVECCGEHLWSVRYRQWPSPRLLTTLAIRDLLTKKRYQNRLSLDTFCGEYGVPGQQAIDPYVLGVLIGDGCLKANVSFTLADDEVAERVEQRLRSSGHIVVADTRSISYRITTPGDTPRYAPKGSNGVKNALVNIGLWGLGSHEKFIPEAYFFASLAERLELMRGLLDTDGTVSKVGGTVQYCTTSPRLARDVRRLAWSLGAVCRISRKTNSYGGAFILTIRANNRCDLFFLPRKQRLCATGEKKKIRMVISAVEEGRSTECQCITVSHPSNLYVTTDFVLTHNSPSPDQSHYR